MTAQERARQGTRDATPQDNWILALARPSHGGYRGTKRDIAWQVGQSIVAEADRMLRQGELPPSGPTQGQVDTARRSYLEAAPFRPGLVARIAHGSDADPMDIALKAFDTLVTVAVRNPSPEPPGASVAG